MAENVGEEEGRSVLGRSGWRAVRGGERGLGGRYFAHFPVPTLFSHFFNMFMGVSWTCVGGLCVVLCKKRCKTQTWSSLDILWREILDGLGQGSGDLGKGRGSVQERGEEGSKGETSRAGWVQGSKVRGMVGPGAREQKNVA